LFLRQQIDDPLELRCVPVAHLFEHRDAFFHPGHARYGVGCSPFLHCCDSGFELHRICDHPRCPSTQSHELCPEEHHQGVVLLEPRFELVDHHGTGTGARLNTNRTAAIVTAMKMQTSTM